MRSMSTSSSCTPSEPVAFYYLTTMRLFMLATLSLLQTLNAFNLTLFPLTNCTVNRQFGFSSYSVPVGVCTSLAPSISAIAYTCGSTSIFSMFFSSACTPGTNLYGNWSIPVGNFCYASPIFGFQITSCAPMASPTPSPSLPAPSNPNSVGFATGTLYPVPGCNKSGNPIPLGNFLRNGCTMVTIGGQAQFSVIAACGNGANAASRSIQVRLLAPFCNVSQFEPMMTYFFPVPSDYTDNQCISSQYPGGLLSLEVAGCDLKSSSATTSTIFFSFVVTILMILTAESTTATFW